MIKRMRFLPYAKGPTQKEQRAHDTNLGPDLRRSQSSVVEIAYRRDLQYRQGGWPIDRGESLDLAVWIW